MIQLWPLLQRRTNGILFKVFKIPQTTFLRRRCRIPRCGSHTETYLKIKTPKASWIQYQCPVILPTDTTSWRPLIILIRWTARLVSLSLNECLLTGHRCLEPFLSRIIPFQTTQSKLFQMIRVHVLGRSPSESGNMLTVSAHEYEDGWSSNWKIWRVFARLWTDRDGEETEKVTHNWKSTCKHTCVSLSHSRLERSQI